MATRNQKKANRKNATRGTGPRTPEGKARSSQNACKHGLFARDTVLPDENREEFIQLIADLEEELEAVGGFEHRLVRHIADAEWRIRRLVRLETGALTHQLERERLRVERIQADLGNLPPALQPLSGGQNQNQLPKPGEENQTSQSHTGGQDQSTPAGPIEQNTQPAGIYQQTTRELGSSIVAYGNSPVLLTLSLYESRLNRKHHSLLKQLRLTQKLRLAKAVETDKAVDMQLPPRETATARPPTESQQQPPPPAANGQGLLVDEADNKPPPMSELVDEADNKTRPMSESAPEMPPPTPSTARAGPSALRNNGRVTGREPENQHP